MEENYLWGQPDASVKFCEDKYDVVPWIAEYTNSISALCYFSIGIVFLNTRLKHIAYDLFFLGISTFLFHMSIRAWGQILDEIAMILLSYDALRDVLNIRRIYVIPILVIYVLLHQYFIFFLILFGSLQAYLVKIGLKHVKPNKKLYLYAYIISFLFAFMFWLGDQFYCVSVKKYYFHAIWHYLSAQAILFGLLSIL